MPLKKKNREFIKALEDHGYVITTNSERHHIKSEAEEIYGEPPAFSSWIHNLIIEDSWGVHLVDRVGGDLNALIKSVRKNPEDRSRLRV